MKKILMLVVALMAVGCAEQEQVPVNLDALVQQGYDFFLDRETMKPYTGPVFQFFPDDTTIIQRAFTLRDGKRGQHGTDVLYHEAGGTLSKSNYKDGKRHGLQRRDPVVGSLRYEYRTYKDGELHGWYVRSERVPVPGTLFNHSVERREGYHNMGEQCGMWLDGVDGGDTITTLDDGSPLDPCPPDVYVWSETTWESELEQLVRGRAFRLDTPIENR